MYALYSSRLGIERPTRIELAFAALQAAVFPLDYGRVADQVGVEPTPSGFSNRRYFLPELLILGASVESRTRLSRLQDERISTNASKAKSRCGDSDPVIQFGRLAPHLFGFSGTMTVGGLPVVQRLREQTILRERHQRLLAFQSHPNMDTGHPMPQPVFQPRWHRARLHQNAQPVHLVA